MGLNFAFFVDLAATLVVSDSPEIGVETIFLELFIAVAGVLASDFFLVVAGVFVAFLVELVIGVRSFNGVSITNGVEFRPSSVEFSAFLINFCAGVFAGTGVLEVDGAGDFADACTGDFADFGAGVFDDVGAGDFAGFVAGDFADFDDFSSGDLT